jgi:hypothetical protein
MKTVHALSIALMLGFAAVLGAMVATRAVNASHAVATRPVSVTTSVASRTASLDRWQHQLQRALNHRPPKLPPLVHFAKVVTPPVASPALVSSVSAPAPRTIYVHAKPPRAPAGVHEHEHEHEGADSGGGVHDD